MNSYIYIFLNPLKPGKFIYQDLSFDFEPFYVGQGVDRRIMDHVKPSHLNDKRSNFKNNVLQKIIKSGYNPLDYALKIKENLSYEDADLEEIRLIKLIGRRNLNLGPLTNLTDGGLRGTGRIATTKGKTYEEIYDKEKSEKLKKERSERFKGKNNPMYGKKSHNKGKPMSKEQKEKLSKSKSKPVKQIDIYGNFIQEWPCKKAAADALGISFSSIGNVLSPNYRSKTAGNYRWEYIDKKNNKYN